MYARPWEIRPGHEQWDGSTAVEVALRLAYQCWQLVDAASKPIGNGAVQAKLTAPTR
jgi:hypothetical protein